MKTKIGLMLIPGLLLCLTGCGRTETSCAAAAVREWEAPEKTFGVMPEPAPEKEPYFQASYELSSIEIPLSECVCEYAGEDFQIYSSFIYYDEKNFPYSGTIVYLQTPADSLQIYSPHDYCIDQENGVIYFLFRDGNDSFGSVYKYFAEDIAGTVSISGAKVLSTYLVEDWLKDAFGAASDEAQSSFSDIHLSITSLEYRKGDVIIGGEASGICIAAGERYYIDWEWNDTTKEENVVPHAFRTYDEEKDPEIYAACQEAFDLFEGGDRSVLAPYENMRCCTDKNTQTGLRMDVNGDGLPELLYVNTDWDEERRILPIEYIYTYTGGMTKTVELVYTDLNDYTEFLFSGDGINLVYDYSDHGQVNYGSYTRYQFDENWEKKPLYRIWLYCFYDMDYYDEEEDAWYKEKFPDTYGRRGGGCYFFKGSPVLNAASESGLPYDWTEEEITEDEFLALYYEMTGFDFLEENEDFSW